MTAEAGPKAHTEGPWDGLLLDLQALRLKAGNPAYSAIGRRIMERRMAAGADEHQARIATSTVHYAFRLGRARINLALTRELVEVLGGEAALVDEWIARDLTSEEALDADVAPKIEAPPAPVHRVLALLATCLALNLIGREFVDFFRLPIYLDMAGTAVAAIALGPWRGAAVGVATNLVGVVGSGWISLPFALVNITGALVWGYGVRRWGMGRTLPRFFSLNVLAALACTLVAVPIIALVLDHDLRVGHDVITELMGESIATFPAALTFSNLLTSLGDKLVSGFLALVVVSALPLAFRRGGDLVAVSSEPR